MQMGAAIVDVPGSRRGDFASGGAVEEYEARYFAVVDHFLEEIGWLAAR